MSYYPAPNVYRFFNQFLAPGQAPEHVSRNQGVRKSGPRSKTGCTTCKARRVKCDETHPECIRCQNLGRECGGYATESTDEISRSGGPVLIHPKPLSSISCSPYTALPTADDLEQRYFQRFCEKTVDEICGLFDARFWKEKVLQLCHKDEAIRHGVIALGALTRSLETTATPTRLSLSGYPQIDLRHLDEHHRFALRQYSLAIASLRCLLADGRRHLRTSLTCCVLFMTLEALQGAYDGAVTHLRGGLRLLGDWRTARAGGQSRLSQDSLSEIQDDVIDDLGLMFARLDLQSLFLPPPCPGSCIIARNDPNPVPDLRVQDLAIPNTFSTIREAKETWDFLMAGIGQFYRKCIYYKNMEQEELRSTRVINQQATHQRQLDQWRNAFRAVRASECPSTTLPDDLVLLSSYYSLSTILLASCLEDGEMVYDRFTNLFLDIVEEAQLLLASKNPTTSSPFVLDLGTILPLGFTALKCRDRQIRRKAVNLLWSKARREGLCYDSIAIARVCAWITCLEGQGVDEVVEVIPESSRVTISNINFNPEERWFWIEVMYVKKDWNGVLRKRDTTFSW
ncbi:hypothetical protein BP5796_06629 [Coleophoma crateriformis]|uniref:Zn(2)-C6 fungal-type domain-containing protein n=1 Tax=Coleophoma crateriformis TaxID=565419 RepID=A0A3D8RPC9_9HELO|nr:hypothetical protein BP5796_06629 [Coleophoma crateriformis]